jgi:hypothetical protein
MALPPILLLVAIFDPAINQVDGRVVQLQAAFGHWLAAVAVVDGAERVPRLEHLFGHSVGTQVNVVFFGGRVVTTRRGAASVEDGFDAVCVGVRARIHVCAVGLVGVVGRAFGVAANERKKKRERAQSKRFLHDNQCFVFKNVK